ncbi:MAG: hypothetical protein EPO06_00905 [Burkholderiaceae bacterium]|nr:MAG: hypothetical protein EPO06_00905 [Burkholderiaceae bacterium]
MDSNRFNQILVVDSIPTGEYNTAKRLFEDLETYATAYSPSPAVRYVRVENAAEFFQCVLMSKNDAEGRDIIPMLHIECHGDEDGFQFADGSLADWDELKVPITELNVATGLNLMVAVAACTGGALAKVMRMGDRAPFWGLIGPTRTLTAGELEKVYAALYLTLLSTKAPANAVQAMDQATTPGLFWRTTSQDLFEKVWRSYKSEHCTAAALEMRGRRMMERLRESGVSPLPSMDELMKRFISHEPIAFERYRQTFFMCDLFPEHSNRFPIEYVA